MIWLIYNMVNGKVIKTQKEEPLELEEFQGKCKCDFVYLGRELADDIEIKAINTDTLEVMGLVTSKPVEQIQVLEKNLTDLEINKLEKNKIISKLELSVTDLEISILELKSGGIK